MKTSAYWIIQLAVGFTLALGSFSVAYTQYSKPAASAPRMAAKPSVGQPFICSSKTDTCFCHGTADCDKMASSGACWGGTTRPKGGGKECDWQHSAKPGGGAAGAASLKAAKGRGTAYTCNSHTMKCTCSGKKDCNALTTSNDCLDDVDDGSCHWKIH